MARLSDVNWPLGLVDGWLARTLTDLQARIARGGRWGLGLSSYGPVKAARLAR